MTWLLLLIVAPPVDVVVLAKHRPTEISLSDCGRARAVDGEVELCRDTCRRQATWTLRCKERPLVSFEGETRRYGRRFSLSNVDGHLRVVATVDQERYVAGVVQSELAGAPREARRAQAIAARTFLHAALSSPRHPDAPLCDLTHCQVFRQTKDPPVAPGVRLSGDAPALYHSTCGGRPACRRSQDGHFCDASPHARWIFDVEGRRLAAALQPLAGRTLDPTSLRLTPDLIEDQSGRIRVDPTRLHLTLGRAFGWGRFKSPFFTAQRLGGAFVIRGRGLGHGLGMCQHGAIERARAGQSAEQILQAYYPGRRLTR